MIALAFALMLQASPASAPEAAPQPIPATVSSDVHAVATVLDAFHAAASRADGPAYFDLFAEGGRFIGTDATELWSVAEFRAYAEPHFAAGRGWTYHPRDRVVRVHGDVAWFDEILDHASYGVLRGSGVLVRTADGWKIEQYVLSFAVPNDVADQVVETIKGDQAP